MKRKIIGLVASALLAAPVLANAASIGNISQVPFNWQVMNGFDLVTSGDDESTGATALGFSVSLGPGSGSFSQFDMSSNGYVQLLGDAELPRGFPFDSVANLIDDCPTCTYILSAYDDLTSASTGHFGYKLLADRAIFTWVTETWQDELSGNINMFQSVLHDSGVVDWNFLEGAVASFDHDLYSGLYAGGTGELLEAIAGDIPDLTSYRYTPVPLPSAVLLLGSGLFGLMAATRRRKR